MENMIRSFAIPFSAGFTGLEIYADGKTSYQVQD